MFGWQELKIRFETKQIIIELNFRPKGVSLLNGSSSEGSDGPTTVFVNLFVRSFEKIDDVKMEFSVQITFRQQWNDNRSEVTSTNIETDLVLILINLN